MHDDFGKYIETIGGFTRQFNHSVYKSWLDNWSSKKHLSNSLGKIHWFFSFIFMNCMFMPMLIAGLAGMLRRGADGGASYAHNQHMLGYNEFMSWSSWMLGLAQLPFIINFIYTILKKRKENPDPNPWKATTLEWTLSSPPPFHQFNELPQIK